MMPSNGQLTVPPGFRFHPTDEELLYYYLRKKVSFEDIDLDVIREVDLNKLEPWDLKEKCRIGSGLQNEWYFFSHKDKKYPTGTRTNRATIAGFWKATGRDKAIHLTNSKKIGMRKTLVFYTGRAPQGQKSDWIMHEYRLDDHTSENQEDGWVVCRVFKKKNYNRGYQVEMGQEEDDNQNYTMKASGSYNHHHHHHNAQIVLDHQSKQNQHIQALYDYGIDGSMYLPQLFSQETTLAAQAASTSTLPFISPPLLSLNTTDLDCSQNLLRLTSNPNSCGTGLLQQNHPLHHQRFIGSDWSFLDKLLASHHSTHTTQLNQQQQQQVAAKCSPSSTQVANYNHVGSSSSQIRFPFQYLGCEAADVLKFSNKSSS